MACFFNTAFFFFLLLCSVPPLLSTGLETKPILNEPVMVAGMWEKFNSKYGRVQRDEAFAN